MAAAAKPQGDVFDYIEIFYEPKRRHGFNHQLLPVAIQTNLREERASHWIEPLTGLALEEKSGSMRCDAVAGCLESLLFIREVKHANHQPPAV